MIDRRRHTVNRRSHKRPGESGGPLMLNIRVRHLRKKGMPPTSNDQVRAALQHLLDKGSMPRGWQFMAVNWKNPRKFGFDWQTGWPERAQTDDEDVFREVFEAVVNTQLRLAEVRQL